MGAVTQSSPSRDVDPIELPQGSWSRMLVTDARVEGQRVVPRLLGLHAGHRARRSVRHETEEVAYVVSGVGEMRLDDDAGAVRGRATRCTVPAGVWHAVANTGDQDVVMVFGFPHPDYPPTERR